MVRQIRKVYKDQGVHTVELEIRDDVVESEATEDGGEV